MKVNSFQENGVTFFQLYIPCPVCFERGGFSSRSFWKHGDSECYGDIYVGDNAHLKCIKCGHSEHLKKCGYSCPLHSNSRDSFVSFRRGVSYPWFFYAFSSMVTETGVLWLNVLASNMDD